MNSPNYTLPWSRRATLLIVVAIAVTSCGDELTSEQLIAFGRHDVGYRELELTYRPAASNEDRVLPVSVWYPANGSGAAPAAYAVAGLVSVDTDVALDAPPVAKGGPFPLAVYSHGSGGDKLLAYPYAELMASHGWVVASPNHMGNTALDAFAGGGVPFARNVLNRPTDLTAVIDWLATGPADDALLGQADTRRVFVFGHSFGGYTTFASAGVDQDFDALSADCATDASDPSCAIYADLSVEQAFRSGFGDPRIVAISPQAPALVPTMAAGGLADLKVPTLLMSARLDLTTTQEVQAAPAWAGLDHPDDLWLEIPNGGHHSFISMCYDVDARLVGLFLDNADEDGCGPQFTRANELLPVLAAYTLGFASWHVLGQTAWKPILRGKAFAKTVEITKH